MTKNEVEQAICSAFSGAYDEVLKKESDNGIRHINESVFRYLLMDRLPSSIRKEDEWRRIDLLLHNEGGFFPVEFKFYDRRPLHNFKSNQHSFKGGPGKQNYAEFLASCRTLFNKERLSQYDKVGVQYSTAYFILVATDHLKFEKNRFHNFYNGRHILDIQKEGIEAEEIARRTDEINGKLIFGWVLRLTAMNRS